MDALNGAPGVYSARYSEDMPDLPGATKDERNTMKLLAALSSVRLWNRSARFRSVVAVCTPEGETLIAPGTWEGSVACSPRGKNGFGYDPVFLDPELGLTAAEMSPEEKMSRSHRPRPCASCCASGPPSGKGISGRELDFSASDCDFGADKNPT